MQTELLSMDYKILELTEKNKSFPQIEFILKYLNAKDNDKNRQIVTHSLIRLQHAGYINRKAAQRSWTDKAFNKEKYRQVKIKITNAKVIKIGLLIASIACIILSFDFTRKFIDYFLQSIGASILFASAIVLLAWGFFEIGIISYKNKRYNICILFFLFWLCVVLPSMGSTVFGQYYGYLEKQNITIKQQIYLNEKEILSQTLKMIDNTISGYEEQKSNLLKQHNYQSDEDFRRENWKIYWNTENNLDKIENAIRSANQERTDILKAFNLYISINPNIDINEKNNFYAFLTEIFGCDYNIIQWWFAFSLSLIIDFLGPIGLAIALWWKNENVKNN